MSYKSPWLLGDGVLVVALGVGGVLGVSLGERLVLVLADKFSSIVFSLLEVAISDKVTLVTTIVASMHLLHLLGPT